VEGSSAVPAAVSLGVPAEGVSLEGVSLEGVSLEGVSAGNVRAGGVPAGGMPAGGMPAGGIPAGGMPVRGMLMRGVSVGGVPARVVSVEGALRVSALAVAVSLPEDFMSRFLRRYLNFLRDLLIPLYAPCIAKYDRLGPSLTELRRTLDPSIGVGSSAVIDLGL
jgi:hypothetical protein